MQTIMREVQAASQKARGWFIPNVNPETLTVGVVATSEEQTDERLKLARWEGHGPDVGALQNVNPINNENVNNPDEQD